MKYTELTIHTTTLGSEIIADIMWNYTDFGVTICDVADIIALQTAKDTQYWDYMDDDLTAQKDADVLVKCYIAEDVASQTIKSIMQDIQNAKELSGGAVEFGTLEDTKRSVDGDDWIDVWKKHFRPIHLGKIVVVPEWIKYEKKEATSYFDGTKDGLLSLMTKCGVDISVTLPIATKPTQTESINIFAASVRDNKIISFATLHPQNANTDKILENIKEAGFKGISSEWWHFTLKDEPYQDTYLQRVSCNCEGYSDPSI